MNTLEHPQQPKTNSTLAPKIYAVIVIIIVGTFLYIWYMSITKLPEQVIEEIVYPTFAPIGEPTPVLTIKEDRDAEKTEILDVFNTAVGYFETQNYTSIMNVLDVPDATFTFNDINSYAIRMEVSDHVINGIYDGELNIDTLQFNNIFATVSVYHGTDDSTNTFTFVKRPTGWKLSTIE